MPFHFDSENKEDVIQFYAGKVDMTERKFSLLSEIAFETWVLALKRWESEMRCLSNLARNKN